jgi:hypothetical protein
MNSIYSKVIISLSIVTFALIPAGIPTAYENVLAQQDGNSSVYPNMSSLNNNK